MTASACILGCAGTALTARERDFLAEADPWGFILFARNVDSPTQLRALTTELRSTVSRDAPVLIDQEGGRVARMTSPHWREWKPPLEHACMHPRDAARKSMYLRYRMIAKELRDVRIDVAGDDFRHVVRCAARLPIRRHGVDFLVGNESAMHPDGRARARGQKQHIAVA